MIERLRREGHRWLIIGFAALRVAKAKRLSARATYLRQLASWERAEAQRILDAMPPSLLRRVEGGERR